MFASEVYRRGIVVPLNATTLEHIRNDEVTDYEEVKLLKIDNDKFFYKIWETGIFGEINQRCGTLVDDYEEEEIGDHLEEIKSIIHSKLRSQGFDDDLLEFFKEFDGLVRLAEEKKMPLFFVF